MMENVKIIFVDVKILVYKKLVPCVAYKTFMHWSFGKKNRFWHYHYPCVKVIIFYYSDSFRFDGPKILKM